MLFVICVGYIEIVILFYIILCSSVYFFDKYLDFLIEFCDNNFVLL